MIQPVSYHKNQTEWFWKLIVDDKTYISKLLKTENSEGSLQG